MLALLAGVGSLKPRLSPLGLVAMMEVEAWAVVFPPGPIVVPNFVDVVLATPPLEWTAEVVARPLPNVRGSVVVRVIVVGNVLATGVVASTPLGLKENSSNAENRGLQASCRWQTKGSRPEQETADSWNNLGGMMDRGRGPKANESIVLISIAVAIPLTPQEMRQQGAQSNRFAEECR